MPPPDIELTGCWKLPPLILHPFAEPGAPEKLLEASRTQLMLHGVSRETEFSIEEIDWKLLHGRYHEIRMLYYVGKDLTRWIEQCMEIVERDETLRRFGVTSASFAALLIEDPPPAVREKLRTWGVEDYRAIFSRAVGLYGVFGKVPEADALSPEFIRHYYHFADYLFACRQQLSAFPLIRARNFQFELYASGEYTRLLENQWQ